MGQYLKLGRACRQRCPRCSISTPRIPKKSELSSVFPSKGSRPCLVRSEANRRTVSAFVSKKYYVAASVTIGSKPPLQAYRLNEKIILIELHSSSSSTGHNSTLMFERARPHKFLRVVMTPPTIRSPGNLADQRRE